MLIHGVAPCCAALLRLFASDTEDQARAIVEHMRHHPDTYERLRN